MKLDDLCKRVDWALRLGSVDYAVAGSQHILRYFPGHIHARILLGQAFLEQGLLAKAGEQFRLVLEVDPENVNAISGIGVVHGRMDDLDGAISHFEKAYEINPNKPEVSEGLAQLYSQRDGVAPPLKVPVAAVARWRSSKKQFTQALREFDELIEAQPESLELQLARAEASWRAGLINEAEHSCLRILTKLPRCLKAKLILAEIMIREQSRERQGLALLHDALAVDPGGTVAFGLFSGSTFKIPSLSEELDVPPLPSPWTTPPREVEAAIAALPKSASAQVDDWSPPANLELEEVEQLDIAKAPADPELAQIQAELQRITSSLLDPRPPRVSGPPRPSTLRTQFTITSKTQLVAKYGREGFDRLDAKLRELTQVHKYFNLESRVVYVDDQASLEPYGIPSVDPTKPDEVKSVVDRLDQVATTNGREFGHLLIVGGDRIIPFFRLHNPADDEDADVASDNPYASHDPQFLMPDRSVGRMPDGEKDGISFLLAQVEMAIAHRHERGPATEPLGCLAALATLGIRLSVPKFYRASFGYSALVWQQASEAVYRLIGDPKALLTSPPITGETFNLNWLIGSNFNYFNLHGAEGSENWYGQKDYSYPEDYPMLPVALTPQIVAQANVTSSVIYTEACYGADILGKSSNNSLALTFLAGGALAVVGSTKTSYGVPAPPLTAADLLGLHFWNFLQAGFSVGEALMKAKTTLVNEVLERQGWLDGDDQKTLLEFVLYGDPSSYLDKAPEARRTIVPEQKKVPLVRSRDHPHGHLHLICRHKSMGRDLDEVPKDLLSSVVSHLQCNCPEMHDGSYQISSCVSCNGQCGKFCQCGAGENHSHGITMMQQVVTFTSKKSVKTADGRELKRLARVTTDHVGSILKTTVTR